MFVSEQGWPPLCSAGGVKVAQAEAKKEFTRKQVGNFFRKYPKMERLVFKAIRSRKKQSKERSWTSEDINRTSQRRPEEGNGTPVDPNDCPGITEKCCFTYRGVTECYCCS